MIEFFEKSGILTIGSRLRRLTDLITRDADEIYRLYSVHIRPKWFPVLYMLTHGNDNTVTGIAKAIGQTHPSVSTIIREMKDAGLVAYEKDTADRRASSITLTPAGNELLSRLDRVCTDVVAIVRSVEDQAEHKLWHAISDWETLLAEKSLLDRVIEAKKLRDTRRIEIVDYNPEYLITFKRLNIMWINSHWSLEPHDLEVLSDPESSILNNGGHILVALVDGAPMGVVALCRMDHPDYDYEIAKLAVDPEARGTGIGDAIFRAAIEKAKANGAKKLFLESNTLLKPAISLYRKFGFRELENYHTAYDRGNIQMELTL